MGRLVLDIRNIRNASIGHPTKQNHKGKRFYNYISRISMGKWGFDLLQHSEPKSYDLKRVDLEEAIRDQLAGIISGCKNILNKLEEVERVHIEKFSSNSLQEIFHSAMSYLFEKIAQGINSYSYGDREFGHIQVGAVKETYKKFETALNDRNELTDYTQFDLNEYFHALDKLDNYLSGKDKYMEEPDARIYLSYIRNEHKRFVQIAKEIDEDYEKSQE